MISTIELIYPSLHRIRVWLRSIFNRRITQAPPTAITKPVAARPKPVSDAPVTVRRKAKARPDTKTLSGLLDSLDDSFRSMSIPRMKGSWLPKKDIRALYKLGVYVPANDWQFVLTSTPRVHDDCLLPTIASSYFIGAKYDTNDSIHPRFVFAIKEPRLPPSVEQIHGTAYRFGVAYEIHEKEHDEKSEKQLFWMWAWIVVRSDGVIDLPHELRPVVNTITHRRNITGRKEHGARVSTIHQRLWQAPSLARHEKMALDESAAWVKCEFLNLITWWNSRGDHWSVGVRKDGHRVTFSIDPQNTSAFFASRDRQVTARGKTRPIIHFVAEHRRVNGSTVKAHVRGLSDFEWRGYRCTVVAPKMRGNIFSVCPLTPVEVDDDTDPAGYITTNQLAIDLAGFEDAPRQPAKHPTPHRSAFMKTM